MATVTGFTAERMLEIENSTVVGGEIDAENHLILTTRDDTEIDAGSVVPALSAVRDFLYPVGAIYLSTVAANPGTIFGGTWVAFGEGKMPIGVAAGGDSRFDVAEETGGSETITANNLPTHTHSITGPSGADATHTHGITGPSGIESADHTHSVNINTGTESVWHQHPISGYHASTTATGSSSTRMTDVAGMSGSTTGTADSGDTGNQDVLHIHNVSGTTAVRSATHTHTLPAATGAGSSHTHTLPANTGNNTTTAAGYLPPFISVHMWKRTA